MFLLCCVAVMSDGIAVSVPDQRYVIAGVWLARGVPKRSAHVPVVLDKNTPLCGSRWVVHHFGECRSARISDDPEFEATKHLERHITHIQHDVECSSTVR